MMNNKFYPLFHHPKKPRLNLAWPKRTLSNLQRSQFLQQFATLFQSGLNILEILTILQNKKHHAYFNQALKKIKNHIAQGHTLAHSFHLYPNYFPNLFCHLLAAGETSGALTEVITQLADHYHQQHQLQQKLIKALAYPFFLLAFTFALLILCSQLMLPTMLNFYQELGIVVPKSTNIFIAMINFVIYKLSTMIILTIITFLLSNKFIKNQKFMIYKSEKMLKLPIYGQIVYAYDTIQWTRILAMCLNAGKPITASLKTTASVVQNLAMRQAIYQTEQIVRQGQTLYTGLAKFGRFKPELLQLIYVGEQAGKLAQMVKNASIVEEQAIAIFLQQKVALIQPIMLIIIGLLVVLAILYLYLPLVKILS